ncbi:predicted protein [Chaetoceros tenuissimus]|uniref:Uncharacterized protein n=1 Tax=Chaetoceros tenuissimus TaxID=426638 RepID=A0AAD3CL46_9STRA|nr:predicted protein [Chaetoceros tenuissimus]
MSSDFLSFLSRCLAQLTTEQQPPDFEIINLLVHLSQHVNFRNRVECIVSIPSALLKALQFIHLRVKNCRGQIHNPIGFQISALKDYIAEHHGSSNLVPYVSSPSTVSSSSSNSNNSLLEENEKLKKRVKELESKQRLPVANKIDEFNNISRNESIESLVISMDVAKTLKKYRKRCKEHKATLDKIQKEAVSESEFQINENDSPEIVSLKKDINAQISTFVRLSNETREIKEKKINSLETKLKQANAVSEQVRKENSDLTQALEDSKKESKDILEKNKKQFKSEIKELEETLFWTKDNYESKVRKELETEHENQMKSVTRSHKLEVKQLVREFDATCEELDEELDVANEEIEAAYEELDAVREELEAERVENSENMGVIDNLLIEDEPEAPSTGEKRTHDHIEKTSEDYLQECRGSFRSEANKDIDLSPEERKDKCTEDLAGLKVPKHMKELFEGLAEKNSFTNEMLQLTGAVALALGTYMKHGVITSPPTGQLGDKETVVLGYSFPDTNKSYESKTTQQGVEFYGEKLSNIPHNLRMTDTKKRLTTIIRDQDPIHKEHKCVTNIKKFRPKLNKKDKQILDDLIEKHKRLAIVAEETQMEMIQLTIEKLGLDVIADIDHRSKQHMELLGREEMIQIEADKDILRKKMPHSTAMKFSRGLNISWKQPLEVTATLLGAAGMLDDGITADIVYERFLLCVDRNFSSEEFDAKHYRAAMYMILDALSMTLFTKAQREEVKRRMSMGLKQHWKRLSSEAREQRILAIQGGRSKHRRNRTPEQRIAMSEAKTVFHFRVTNLDTEEIVLEGFTQQQVIQSDFGKEYTETTSKLMLNFLRDNLKGEGTIRLNFAGVEYSIEKYYKEKGTRSEERIAMRKAIAVYHFRVTNLDTEEIVLEGLPQSLVIQSDFGKEYKETTSNSLRYFLRNNIKGEGTIRLTMAGVEYSIEKYYKEKGTNF